MATHPLRSLLGASLVALSTLACAPEARTRDVGVPARPAQRSASKLQARVTSAPLHRYEQAPRSPDAVDPAIWVNRKHPDRSLVLGTIRDGGLVVYDLGGTVVQTLLPPHRQRVTAADPPVAGPQREAGTSPCPESASGRTHGRFDHVDVVYDFPLRRGSSTRLVDLAVLTDSGCDRLRSYAIDATADPPLRDLTASDAPRAFPSRWERPSPLQAPGSSSQLVDNPLDDQSTAYGIALTRLESSRGVVAFVTQRSRTTIAEFELKSTSNGQVSYQKTRELRFDPIFSLPASEGRAQLGWTPCREQFGAEPQFEGLVVDAARRVLYAAQAWVGLWRVELHPGLPPVVDVAQSALFEPTKSFGLPYFAVPNEGETSCEFSPPDPPVPGTLAASGNSAVAGRHLEPDVSGLALYELGRESGYLIASSQGDDTFHVFARERAQEHLGAFEVKGSGGTEGHAVAHGAFGPRFPLGLFITQNGQALGPDASEPTNRYEYHESSAFEYLGWEQIAAQLSLAVALD